MAYGKYMSKSTMAAPRDEKAAKVDGLRDDS